MAVQGFGNVGSVSADLLAKIGAKIVAVTDWKGGVYNPAGLDIAKMLDFAKQHKTIDGFPGGEPIENDQLFGLDVDVLVPAALENQITMENAPIIHAKIVAEGANGPTTPDAHRHLHERGVFVIPDILANAGGVTTSYFEWVQDRHGYFWEEAEVNQPARSARWSRRSTTCSTPRSATRPTCAPPPTSSPSIASRPSRGCAACTRKKRRGFAVRGSRSLEAEKVSRGTGLKNAMQRSQRRESELRFRHTPRPAPPKAMRPEMTIVP